MRFGECHFGSGQIMALLLATLQGDMFCVQCSCIGAFAANAFPEDIPCCRPWREIRNSTKKSIRNHLYITPSKYEDLLRQALEEGAVLGVDARIDEEGAVLGADWICLYFHCFLLSIDVD